MMRFLSVAIAVLWLAESSALAQPSAQAMEAAQGLFAKATTAYNLGRFDEAVELFSKAYESWPQPEFLYNIAQSYRLAKNCKPALHFYKRFRSIKEQDTAAPLTQKKQDEIEKFITELTECVAKADRTAVTQPDTIVKPQLTPPAPPATTAAVPSAATAPTPAGRPGLRVAALDTPRKVGGDAVANARPEEVPGLIVVRFAGGVALISAADLGIPVQPAVRLTGGYPIHLTQVTLELGAALSYTPLPYEVMGDQKTGMMLAGRATAVASFPITPKLSLRGELGLGVVSLSGLVAGNPLSANRTTGSFTLPSVALGVGLDYAVARRFSATLSPLSLAFSRGADGMYASSLRELDFVVGLGYRP